MQKGLTSLFRILSQQGLMHCWVCGLPMVCDCKHNNHGICSVCLDLIEDDKLHCDFCGRVLASKTGLSVCGVCVQKPQLGFFVSVGEYDFPISQLIHQFKFNRHIGLDKALGQLLLSKIDDFYQHRQLPLPELVLPVPLHKKRFWQRGYNQSALIARYCARNLNVSFDAHLITRVLFKQPQMELSGKDRLKNIRGAFEIQANKAQTLEGKYVVLVDDVKTTGATLNEIKKLLLKSGCRQVDIWVLANTPPLLSD